MPDPTSQASPPKSAAVRPLWIIAISMATIAVCLVFLVIKRWVDEPARSVANGNNEPEARSGSGAKRSFPTRAFDTTTRSAPPAAGPGVTNIVEQPQITVHGGGGWTAVPVPVSDARGGIIAPLTAPPATNWITALIGKVTLRGKAPPETVLTLLQADPVCSRFYKSQPPPTTHHFVVGKDNGLGNVLVYVDGEVKNSGPRLELPRQVLVTYSNCMIQPQITAMHVSQELVVRNDDEATHSFHIVPEVRPNADRNKLLATGRSTAFRFLKPEMFVKIRCDLHPWELGWVSVMANPYFAVTDGEGAYTIPNLPEGKYRVRALHRKAIANEDSVRDVVVRSGQPTTVNLTLYTAESLPHSPNRARTQVSSQ